MLIRFKINSLELPCLIIIRDLDNPIKCIERCVALEGDRCAAVVETAHACLLNLHERLPEYLTTRCLKGVRLAFDSQRRLSGAPTPTTAG